MKMACFPVVVGLAACCCACAVADTHYAAHNGQAPGGSFTSWETAASNIQEAVNAAAAGDTVLVGAGRYTLPPNPTNCVGTNVVYVNRSLIVRSSNGVPESTIIDGEGTYRGVTIFAPFTLDGVTISNCYATNSGGGLMVVQAAGTGLVKNCIIADNIVGYGTKAEGGGIWAGYTSPYNYVNIISNCIIRNNRALSTTGQGGGLFVSTYIGYTLTIDTLFENNSAANGGGIKFQWGGNSYGLAHTVERCVIRGNIAGGSYGGGGLCASTPSKVVMRNCLIHNNRATNAVNSYGGAFTHQDNTRVTTQEFYNCTIVSNTAPSGGGGIFIRDWTSVSMPCPVIVMYNSIVCSNGSGNISMKAPAGYTNIIMNSCSFPSNANFRLAGTGNITNNPRFVNFAGGDFRLAENSPCVNAGTNQVWMTDAIDLNGNPRLFGNADMGCYELPYLVREGQAHADIVISINPARMTILAAGELQTNIYKISGATLPIVTTPGTDVAAHIYIGRSDYTDQLGLSDEGLEHGAFRIVSGNNWLALLGRDRDYAPPQPYNSNYFDRIRMMAEWDALTGQTWDNIHSGLYNHYNSKMGIWAFDERGSLNAVNEYLRVLGVRWYFPGSLGEVVPQAASIALPVADETVRPDFALRNLCFYYHMFLDSSIDEIMWQLRLGLNFGADIIGVAPPYGGPGHGIVNVINRDEVKQSHPEYYALWNGKRSTNENAPCLSSEGLFTQNVAYVRAVYDIYTNEPMVSVMPSDGYVNLCECGLCAGKGTPERGYTGRLSDYVWDYVNRVVTNINLTHPGRKISCCAYGAYLLPPTNITTLNTNIAVTLCQWRSGFYDPAVRATYTNLVTAWLDKSPARELYIWDYYLHGNQAQWKGVPVYFPHVIAENLKFLKGKSRGDFIEVYRMPGTNDTSMAAYHLNCYATARLYWDADQDIDEILDDYCQKFYGPAATEMKTFIDYCETNWPNLRYDRTARYRMLELLDAARCVVGDGVYSQRVDVINEYVQPIRNLCDRFVAQNGQTPVYPYTNWATAASNIQDAVNAAFADGTVVVGAGRYTLPPNATNYYGTNVVYANKPLTLCSSNGMPESTIIDGGGANRGITIYAPFVLDGFTISNCYAASYGGGILVVQAAGTGLVRNCIIVDNSVGAGTASQGGGMWAGYTVTMPYNYVNIISNCTFRNNRALFASGIGGGVFLSTYLGCTLTADTLFENNSAANGGGVFLAYAGMSDASLAHTLERCVIRGNIASGSYGGGGLCASTPSKVVMRNCLIHNNRATNAVNSYGGAFTHQDNTRVTTQEFYNCTIVSNTAPSGGGGIFIRDWTSVSMPCPVIVMYNSIVCSNGSGNISMKAPAGYTNIIMNSCSFPSNANFRLAGTGNITNNPRFVNFAGGDFRLAEDSTCINSGINQSWMESAVDLDGNARILQDTVDMGAYESDYESRGSQSGMGSESAGGEQPSQPSAVNPGPSPADDDSVPGRIVNANGRFDFGGKINGACDLVVYNESSGLWDIKNICSGYSTRIIFGGDGCIPAPGDYDGDNITDPAVYASGSGIWQVMLSGSEHALAQICLEPSAGSLQPVPGDYDGDNTTDPAMYSEQDGTWSVMLSGNGYACVSGAFGGPGCVAVHGDYDGDMLTDPAVYRESDGVWAIITSGAGYALVAWDQPFGGPGFSAAPADYDGDECADICVYEQATGLWIILPSGTLLDENGYKLVSGVFGGAGFIPVPADYTGDGMAELCVYDEATGNWYIMAIDGTRVAWPVKHGGAGFVPVKP